MSRRRSRRRGRWRWRRTCLLERLLVTPLNTSTLFAYFSFRFYCALATFEFRIRSVAAVSRPVYHTR